MTRRKIGCVRVSSVAGASNGVEWSGVDEGKKHNKKGERGARVEKRKEAKYLMNIWAPSKRLLKG